MNCTLNSGEWKVLGESYLSVPLSKGFNVSITEKEDVGTFPYVHKIIHHIKAHVLCKITTQALLLYILLQKPQEMLWLLL